MTAEVLSTLGTEMQVILSIALAMGLGAVIGLDREIAGKPAGLRTHMLVAGAAALFVPLGETIVRDFSEMFANNVVSVDPVRIIESVITGISFLGAGTIIQRRQEGVEGLTTAASLLFTSGLGVTVALGRTFLAIGATILVFITLKVLGLIERKLLSSDNERKG